MCQSGNINFLFQFQTTLNCLLVNHYFLFKIARLLHICITFKKIQLKKKTN